MKRIANILFWLFVCGSGFTQEVNIDSLSAIIESDVENTERINAMLALTVYYANNDPNKAVQYGRKALRLSKEYLDTDLIGRSYSDLAYAFYVQNQLDSFSLSLNEAIDFYEQNGLEEHIPRAYRNLAKIGEATNDPDTSIYFLDKCMEALVQYPDSSILGDVHLSKGFAYRTLGYYNLSLEELFKSLEIFERLENDRRLSYVYQNIGITNAMMDRFTEAIDFSKKACSIFERGNNLRALAQTQNNIGKMYDLMGGNPDSSRVMHHSSLKLAQQTMQDWVVKQNYWNLGRMEFDEERLDSATYWLSRAYEMGEASDDEFMLGGVLRYQARIALKQDQNDQARRLAMNSLQYMKDYNDPNMTQEAAGEYAVIFEALGDFERALAYKKQEDLLHDSLYTLEKDQQIAELNLIYETEKKNHAIDTLEQQAQIDQAKKRALWIGLISLGLLGLFIVWNLIQKRRKDRILFEKEKELEIAKRKNVELELEVKEKELTAKILQLAKKNEFLLSLEDELETLKIKQDQKVKSVSNRISRMIHRDANQDEEWEQFARSFSSIHKDFIRSLIAKHGSFSKSEMRLIALLKMNLSSKDIANILRISDEGIKKARYRLRKKLDLDREIDLQEYLLGYNPVLEVV